MKDEKKGCVCCTEACGCVETGVCEDCANGCEHDTAEGECCCDQVLCNCGD